MRGKVEPVLRDPPLPRGLLSHTDQATGLVSETFVCYTTVAGQCRDLTGLRCFLYVSAIADKVNLTHVTVVLNHSKFSARHHGSPDYERATKSAIRRMPSSRSASPRANENRA